MPGSAPRNIPVESPDSPQDREPDSVGTPEGDNEYPTDTPLAPAQDDGLQKPPGSAPGNYNSDHTPEEKPSGIVKFIDEVARGEFM